MPIPSSRTVITASPFSARAERPIRPPCSVYLAALCSRLPTICSSRTGSAWTRSGSAGGETVSSWRRAVEGRPVRLDGALEDGFDVDHLAGEVDLAAGDPGDVEQVVDQPGQVLGLAVDDLPRPPLLGVVGADQLSTWAALRIGARGLRSSWARSARNSSLRRSASRSASSVSLRSVMSITEPM